MKLQWIDTHSHLHFPAYDEDREAVLLRMRETQGGTITVGTSIQNSKQAILCAEKTENVWAAVGFHPEHITSSFHDDQEGQVQELFDEKALKLLAQSSEKVVAIGETGLDFYRVDNGTSIEEAQQKQEDIFRLQVKIACELHLPLIIHCRDAFDRVVQILEEMQSKDQPISGVIHSFTGSWEQAIRFLDAGFFIGINGIVTFPPRKTTPPEHWLSRIAEQLPLDRMLLETDAPYLSPTPHRGKRNEPNFVLDIAREIAHIKGRTEQEILFQALENARSLFRLK